MKGSEQQHAKPRVANFTNDAFEERRKSLGEI